MAQFWVAVLGRSFDPAKDAALPSEPGPAQYGGLPRTHQSCASPLLLTRPLHFWTFMVTKKLLDNIEDDNIGDTRVRLGATEASTNQRELSSNVIARPEFWVL